MKPWRCVIFRSCVLALAVSLAACGHESAPPATGTSATVPAVTVTSESISPVAEGRAHAIVLEAASCWLSGLWSDAARDEPAARNAAIVDRCRRVLHAAGETSDRLYGALRAVDPVAVDALAGRIGKMAQEDTIDRPHAAAILTFFRAIAAASREEVDARRAADRVKGDYAFTSSAEQRRTDKDAAAPELSRSAALVALLEDNSPYAVEARVVGLLYAVDRMEIARGLPKHLKTTCVEGVGLEVFRVAAPRVSGDPAAPIPTGTWLGYLSSMASAAGHPVPDDARDPQNREPLAWNGTLLGLADHLRQLRTGTILDPISQSVVARIDRQAASARASFDAHAPGTR